MGLTKPAELLPVPSRGSTLASMILENEGIQDLGDCRRAAFSIHVDNGNECTGSLCDSGNPERVLMLQAGVNSPYMIRSRLSICGVSGTECCVTERNNEHSYSSTQLHLQYDTRHAGA